MSVMQKYEVSSHMARLSFAKAVPPVEIDFNFLPTAFLFPLRVVCFSTRKDSSYARENYTVSSPRYSLSISRSYLRWPPGVRKGTNRPCFSIRLSVLRLIPRYVAAPLAERRCRWLVSIKSLHFHLGCLSLEIPDLSDKV